jgi:hypothetical protein
LELVRKPALTGKVAASSGDSLCLSQVRVDFERWDKFVFASL